MQALSLYIGIYDIISVKMETVLTDRAVTHHSEERQDDIDVFLHQECRNRVLMFSEWMPERVYTLVSSRWVER